MRDLYQQYLYIPKNGRMSDKAFLGRIAVSVCFIIACLAAMAFSAYAYFTGTIASETVTITAANYDLDWVITDAAGYQSVNKGILAEAPAEYEIVISLPDTNDMATTGFCVIKVDYADSAIPDEVYHTVQFGKDIQNGDRKELTFKLQVNQAATISFIPHWGTSSIYAVGSDDEKCIDGTRPIILGNKKPSTSASTTTSTQQATSLQNTDATETTTSVGETVTGGTTDVTVTGTTAGTDTTTETEITTEATGVTTDTAASSTSTSAATTEQLTTDATTTQSQTQGTNTTVTPAE